MNQDLYDAGLATRRRVLGDAYVDASLAAATEFSRDIQEYVTQYCWGDLWNRPGLSLQERSLINLSMIIALNRSQEFKAHVRGAVNNGVSREQIKEVLMQSAFYCGGPAALEAFRNAAEVFAAMDAEARGGHAGERIAMTITRVGFIGLGNMGSPMAGHLVDAGFALTVSDAAPGVTERFVAGHPAAIAAAGPESFAAVQALILMLPTSADRRGRARAREGGRRAAARVPGHRHELLRAAAHPQRWRPGCRPGACRCSTPRSRAVCAAPGRPGCPSSWAARRPTWPGRPRC